MAAPFRRIEDMQQPAHTIIIGSTISGKSHLLKYIFSKIGARFDYGILFSSTVGLSRDYDYIPIKYQFATFDAEVVNKLINKQRQYIQEWGKEKAPKVFIIIDDCSGFFDRTKDGFALLEWLWTTGRHLNISCFALLQQITQLTPAIRSNTRYVFVTLTNAKNLEYLVQLVKGFDGKRDLKRYLDEVCVNYRVAAFDTHGVASAQDSRFCIKAPARVRPFRLQY